MNDDRNQYQIIRIDARNCFVESLSDAFSIGKAHLTFCSYDKRRPTGQRMTDSIQIYIDMPDWLELCRMLDSGELRWLLQQSLKSGDRSPIREWLGGTSAKKLASFGKPRADGKSLSRTAQLLPGSKTDSLLFVANSGPGEENATGLIVPKFGKNPEQHVAVSMTLDNLSKLLLLTRIHYTAWLTAGYMRQGDSGREQPAPSASARSRTEQMPQKTSRQMQPRTLQTPSKPTIQSPVAMF